MEKKNVIKGKGQKNWTLCRVFGKKNKRSFFEYLVVLKLHRTQG